MNISAIGYDIEYKRTVSQNSKESGTNFSEAIREFTEAHKLTAAELKEDIDWRKMSDDEWDKLLEGVDKQVDAFKEHLQKIKEMQEEAMQKAAAKAAPGLKSIAASAAALKVAASGMMPTTDGEYVKSDDWTKNLATDDQAVLLEAKEARERASAAVNKMQEILAKDTVAAEDSRTAGSIVKKIRGGFTE